VAVSESQHHRPREVIEPRWQEVTSFADLVRATEPAIMWLGEAVDPPPPIDLLFPELANAEVRTHHFYLPTGRARIGLACLPQAIVSGRSLVGSPTHLYRLGPMTAAYVDDFLKDNMPVGDRDLGGKAERLVPGVSVLLTHWNIETYGHWLLEGLPRLLLLRRLLDELPPLRILLPRSAPGFIRDWIDLVLPAAKVALYDDDTEYLLVETLLVPTVLFVSRGHHFHPELVSLLDELLPPQRQGADARLYVARFQPDNFRQLSNREEIEAIAVSEGLELVRPETMPITEQIALFARARIIVGDFGSAMHNTLFSPPGALVLCLNMVTGLQTRIAELKRQRVGYLLPSSGEAVMYRFGAPRKSYHIDPQQFRAYVRACHAISRGHEPGSSDLAPPHRSGEGTSEEPRDALGAGLEAAPSPMLAPTGSTNRRAIAPALTPVKRLISRGVKVVWWTVTLQLPRRLRAYRAYRSARPPAE